MTDSVIPLSPPRSKLNRSETLCLPIPAAAFLVLYFRNFRNMLERIFRKSMFVCSAALSSVCGVLYTVM